MRRYETDGDPLAYSGVAVWLTAISKSGIGPLPLPIVPLLQVSELLCGGVVSTVVTE